MSRATKKKGKMAMQKGVCGIYQNVKAHGSSRPKFAGTRKFLRAQRTPEDLHDNGPYSAPVEMEVTYHLRTLLSGLFISHN